MSTFPSPAYLEDGQDDRPARTLDQRIADIMAELHAIHPTGQNQYGNPAISIGDAEQALRPLLGKHGVTLRYCLDRDAGGLQKLNDERPPIWLAHLIAIVRNADNPNDYFEDSWADVGGTPSSAYAFTRKSYEKGLFHLAEGEDDEPDGRQDRQQAQWQAPPARTADTTLTAQPTGDPRQPQPEPWQCPWVEHDPEHHPRTREDGTRLATIYRLRSAHIRCAHCGKHNSATAEACESCDVRPLKGPEVAFFCRSGGGGCGRYLIGPDDGPSAEAQDDQPTEASVDDPASATAGQSAASAEGEAPYSSPPTEQLPLERESTAPAPVAGPATPAQEPAAGPPPDHGPGSPNNVLHIPQQQPMTAHERGGITRRVRALPADRRPNQVAFDALVTLSKDAADWAVNMLQSGSPEERARVLERLERRGS